MTTLRLFITADFKEQSLHDWVLLDLTGRLIRQGKSGFRELPICGETEVVIPTGLVSFIDIKLPDIAGKKLEAALPFIVEEYVLSSPEDVHVIIASRLGDQATLAIIQKAWVKELVAALSMVKLQAKRMFPDCMLLALNENTWTLSQQGNKVLVRTGKTQGFAFDVVDSDRHEIPYLLMSAFKEKHQFIQPSNLLAYGELAETVKEWARMLGTNDVAAIKEEWRFNKFAATFNLLQKEFSPPNDLVQKIYKFKTCAVLASLIFGLQCFFTLIEVGLQYRQAYQLDQQMISLFKASFPETTTIVDAPLQMQRKLEEIKHARGEANSADYQPLLASISKTIGAIPVENLISMAYQDRKIILIFRIERLEKAEAMRQKLSDAGLMTTLVKGRVNDSFTEVQLLVSGGLK